MLHHRPLIRPFLLSLKVSSNLVRYASSEADKASKDAEADAKTPDPVPENAELETLKEEQLKLLENKKELEV